MCALDLQVGVSTIELPDGAAGVSAIRLRLAEGAPDIDDDANCEPALRESLGGCRVG